MAARTERIDETVRLRMLLMRERMEKTALQMDVLKRTLSELDDELKSEIRKIQELYGVGEEDVRLDLQNGQLVWPEETIED